MNKQSINTKITNVTFIVRKQTNGNNKNKETNIVSRYVSTFEKGVNVDNMHQSKLNHINFSTNKKKNKLINFLLSLQYGKKKSFNLENHMCNYHFITYRQTLLIRYTNLNSLILLFRLQR